MRTRRERSPGLKAAPARPPAPAEGLRLRRARAVVFDLWDTVVRWDDEIGEASLALVAEALGAPVEETRAAWADGHVARCTGPMRDYLRTLGLEGEVVDGVAARRRALIRQALVPVDGAVATLRELRSRGLRLGLLSICSGDVSEVWSDTTFAGLFDVEVFSCDVGLLKPDPRIYALTCARLGVEAGEALFVGDGANDELAGAERAGLRAVQVSHAGPRWPWDGSRISAIPEVLELV